MKTADIERMIAENTVFDEKFIKENGMIPVYELIGQLLEEHNMTKSALIKQLNVERTYGYQMLNGTRPPTRECLMKISLAIKLNLEETQNLLQMGFKNILYARNITDAKTIYAIEHGMDYEKAVEFIWSTE